jgi:hypothetical protein
MKSNAPDQDQQTFLYSGFKEMLNPKEPLYQLSERIAWKELEKAFAKYYVEFGRPAKPIRLMASLLLLKQMYNLDSCQEQLKLPDQSVKIKRKRGKKIFVDTSFLPNKCLPTSK